MLDQAQSSLGKCVAAQERPLLLGALAVFGPKSMWLAGGACTSLRCKLQARLHTSVPAPPPRLPARMTKDPRVVEQGYAQEARDTVVSHGGSER